MKNPRLLQTTKTMLATVALTGLMVGSAARLHATPTGNSDQSSSFKGQLAADSDSSKHDCKGKNSKGGKYSGTVEIKHEGGDKVSVHWDLGKEQDDGDGVLKDGILTVKYRGTAKGKVAYIVKKRGEELMGSWKNAGGESGSETLIKKK